MNRRLAVAVSLATALSAPAGAYAGCGSAFCTVNADWGTQGLWTEPGGRVDLRFEFIDLKQPKQGATKVGLGEVPEETEEVQTINRNWIAAFDYNFDGHWGVSAMVPLVNRYHDHIVDPEGEPTPEQWAFTELGDVRVQGRYRFTVGANSPLSAGFALGLKLPTGSFDVTNSEGVAAERMLSPARERPMRWSLDSSAARSARRLPCSCSSASRRRWTVATLTARATGSTSI